MEAQRPFQFGICKEYLNLLIVGKKFTVSERLLSIDGAMNCGKLGYVDKNFNPTKCNEVIWTRSWHGHQDYLHNEEYVLNLRMYIALPSKLVFVLGHLPKKIEPL